MNNAIRHSVFLLVFLTSQGFAAKVYFWERSNFTGRWYSADIRKGNCFTMPKSWHGRITSVNTQNSCIVAWDNCKCTGKSLKIRSYYVHLGPLGFDDAISSFELCPPKDLPANSDGCSASDEWSPPDYVSQVSLHFHNKFRQRHNAPDLVWDEGIQTVAQRWADHLAKIDKVEDSSTHFGENIGIISMTTAGSREQAIRKAVEEVWYPEVKYYNYDYPEENYNATKHFSQLVWKESVKLGVGVSSNRTGHWYVVANYDPAGNVEAKYAENVEKPGK